ncbi:pre-mRNA-splicing factor 38B [Pochonia chlamydosporia 170]|uniref:Pre-mRNA-splicing factor 38B n=1 Tax=Pochonia chlamydosporia 170 TaxID=1380566 RepID=A0A179FSY9_METCM|nr:pre-mRNA-splicing factor 38B [Pochonia chlamydosporia 170]OAQ68477.1 pre-mRNA-splicing factor 38B [Pochonia chlamydosporia 170]
MSNDELLTDDYVAGLLAQDANDCSLKYSAMGMEAFRDNKKPSNLPKPNTRFLRHIIKDTNTHNKALLAKEAAESRARLKDLEYAEDVKRRKTNPNAKDIRRRQMGDIHAILGGKKRRREDDDSGRSTPRDRSDSGSRSERKSSKRRDDLFDEGSEKQRHGRLSERDYADHDGESRSEDKRKSRRSRHHASPDHDDTRHRHSRSRRDRSKSPRHHRSRSPDDQKRSHRHRSRHRSRSKESSQQNKKSSAAQDQDSDPLEDLIGPAPPPKYRGRGTIGGAAELDRRFSASYDPKLDVRMSDDDADPWDDAVESFRDRQKLRLHQDQRLKDAGFTDEQIQRSKGASDKLQDNVVWSKAGEKREWDKGKGVGMDGVDEDDDRPRTLFSEDY